MSDLVLDASVAFKWFVHVGEDLTHQARDLLERYSKGQVRFVVPDLFWAEFGNILWKAVRQRRIRPASAASAVSEMRGRNLPTVASASLIEDAFAIANAFDRTVYDSLYVALAVSVKAEFVTADERLANALAARLPVKWLGAP